MAGLLPPSSRVVLLRFDDPAALSIIWPTCAVMRYIWDKESKHLMIIVHHIVKSSKLCPFKLQHMNETTYCQLLFFKLKHCLLAHIRTCNKPKHHLLAIVLLGVITLFNYHSIQTDFYPVILYVYSGIFLKLISLETVYAINYMLCYRFIICSLTRLWASVS